MSREQHRRAKLIRKLMEQKAITESERDGREPTITRRRWVTTENVAKTLIDATKRFSSGRSSVALVPLIFSL